MNHPLPEGTKVQHSTRRPFCPRAVVIESIIIDSEEINGSFIYMMENGKKYPQTYIIKVVKNDQNETC